MACIPNTPFFSVCFYTFPAPAGAFYPNDNGPSHPPWGMPPGPGVPYTVTPYFFAMMVRMTSTQVSSPRAALSRQRS